jgi:hypothetical protein
MAGPFVFCANAFGWLGPKKENTIIVTTADIKRSFRRLIAIASLACLDWLEAVALDTPSGYARLECGLRTSRDPAQSAKASIIATPQTKDSDSQEFSQSAL